MSTKKKALISGVTGQDGSYLAEFLLEKDYEVHGLIRRSSSINTGRIDHIFHKLHLHYADLTDSSCLTRIVSEIKPDELYNLGAMSHVRVSFEMAEYTANVDAMGTLRLLEAIRSAGLTHYTKFYQASTSELFGKVQEVPQRETTPFYPRSPYGVAKLYAHWMVVNYREAYNLFAVSALVFNHESPRRGETFVTRKIARAVAKIKKGIQDEVCLGNLDAKRDWGHASDYVEGMWLMLQYPEPEDFVLASGETHSVREFVELAFARVGILIQWKGERGSEEEVGVDKDGNVRVKVDPKYFRPTEVDLLLGDASKAKEKLGWKPKISFENLVNEMVDFEVGR